MIHFTYGAYGRHRRVWLLAIGLAFWIVNVVVGWLLIAQFGLAVAALWLAAYAPLITGHER